MNFKNNKGEALIIEQVFVLLFGVLILVTVITVFANVRDDAYEFVGEEQMGVVGNYVHTALIKAQRSMEVSSYGKIRLDIPAQAGGDTYYVYLNNTSIKVAESAGYLNYTVDIANIDKNLFGNISSSAGGKKYIIYNSSAGSVQLKTES